MADLRFDIEWLSYPDEDPKVGETTAQLKIHVDGFCLTRNEDLWSRTVRDSVVVSLYPLALWFASSWWRLNHEILPVDGGIGPGHDWRMRHEPAAANGGFVWPSLILAPDRDEMQIWAQPSQDQMQTSVKYLNGLCAVCTVPKQQFVHEVDQFIDQVIARLHETGQRDSELTQLWALIQEDRDNPKEDQKRRIEAKLGFDPEDCPAPLMSQAIALEKRVGGSSFSELAGAYAGQAGNGIDAMNRLVESSGIVGKPEIPDISTGCNEPEPWKRALSAAQELRRRISVPEDAIPNTVLYGLLGLSKRDVESWSPAGCTKASVAEPSDKSAMKFIPRKTHPVARRFELARFIADYTRSKKHDPESWLVTADLSTARQKFQRAFAAEFLCPTKYLFRFLGGDFSESAVEDAAYHFSVSERTVESKLMNSGYLLQPSPETDLPYDLAL